MDKFEPQKFFIGLMEFFSVLLPGALLTYVAKDTVGPAVLGRSPDDLGDAERWIVFFFSSYLLGHFIFLIGSWLDEAYDLARKLTLKNRMKELARTERWRPKWQRFLLWLVFKRERDAAVDCARAIKKRYLDPLQASDDAVNTFQWSKLRLAIDKPDTLAAVQRFEADSKFFRSLVVVLVVMPFVGGWNRVLVFAVVAAVLLPFAFWRYMEQRHKASSQAYWSVIALEGTLGRAASPEVVSAAEQPEAIGCVYRVDDASRVQYVLVQADKYPYDWGLPGRHFGPGDDPREAALWGVRAQAGVFATIEADLHDGSGDPTHKNVDHRFYLMRSLEQWKPDDRLRGHGWHTHSEALKKVDSRNKAALERAERQRASLLDPPQETVPPSLAA